MTRFKFTLLLIAGLLTVLSACTNKEKESQKYMREGMIYLNNSQLEVASTFFDKAVKLNPENEEAWYGLALVQMNHQKYQNAIDIFDKAIHLKPTYTDAYYNRGQCYFYLSARNAACDDWKKAFELGKPNMEDKLRMCR